MKIVFEFATDNRAFQADHSGLSGQTANLIERFPQRIRQSPDGELDGFTHPLHDDLGNVVSRAPLKA